MKIVKKPVVEVIAHTKFVGSNTFLIPPDGDDSVKISSMAAKICYDSDGIDGRPNIDNQAAVLEHKHGSVLEHSSVSLYITGVTRGLTLELNRHRTFAISQRSTRYTKEEDSAIVLEPYYAELFNKFRFQPKLMNELELWYDPEQEKLIEPSSEYLTIREFINSCSSSILDYKDQVNNLMLLNPMMLSGFELRKWARGKARNILPHALETRGVWTNNHRGWRWIIESRSDKHAEPEIRRLAEHLLNALSDVAPLYYQDFETVEIYDDIPVYKPKYSKV